MLLALGVGGSLMTLSVLVQPGAPSLLAAILFGLALPALLLTTAPLATDLLLVAGVAVGVRLLVARVDPWTGGSLLTIGLLHSSLDATGTVPEPSHDWVRTVTTVAIGIGAVAFGRPAAAYGAARAGSVDELPQAHGLASTQVRRGGPQEL